VVVLNSDGEAAAAAVLHSYGEAATGFVLGDEMRGGGRGEAAANMEEDVAPRRSVPNGSDGDFGLELSERR
jgi:hypothetical protein